jgi:hypothetical protein
LIIKLPLIIVTFFIFRIIFFIFIKCKFSALFRSYSFTGFLFIMIIEGNVSYFAYLFISDLTFLYTLDYDHSLLNAAVIALFFVHFLFLICNSLMFLAFYNKLSMYLYNNIRPIFIGVQFLTISIIKNALVGIINSLLQYDFEKQIMTLILLEFLYFSIVLCFFYSLKIFYSKLKNFIYLCVCVIKILLMISFFVKTEQSNQSYLKIESIHSNIVVIILSLWTFSCIAELFIVIKPIYQYFFNSK